jgi:hypothetical protein
MALSTGAIRTLAREHSALMDDAPKTLLTFANQKTVKGEKRGYRTAILHLSPANLAGFEVCAGRTPGCTAACLNTAGMGGIDDPRGPSQVHVARMRRTRLFKRDKSAFGLKLERELASHVRTADRQALVPVVRLNGTSDLPWENVRFTWADGSASTVFERFPDVQFYDYTKVVARLRKPLPANYDLTFSLADGNEEQAEEAISLGYRVAVVLRNRANPGQRKWDLPSSWNGVSVVDADETDLRFLDPPAVYCGLRAKGLAKADTTGFVHDV